MGIAHQHYGVERYEICRRPAGGVDAVLGLHAGDDQGSGARRPGILQPAIETGGPWKALGRCLSNTRSASPTTSSGASCQNGLPAAMGLPAGPVWRTASTGRAALRAAWLRRLMLARVRPRHGGFRAVKEAHLDVDDEQRGAGKGRHGHGSVRNVTHSGAMGSKWRQPAYGGQPLQTPGACSVAPGLGPFRPRYSRDTVTRVHHRDRHHEGIPCH